MLDPDGRLGPARATIPPHRVTVFDIAPLAELDRELAFLETWPAPHGEGRAAYDHARSLSAEREADAFVQWNAPVFADTGRVHSFTLRLTNRGTDPLIVSDVLLPGTGGEAAAGVESRILGPGETVDFPGTMDSAHIRPDGWIQVRWRLQRGHREWAGCRWIRPLFSPPAAKIP